MIGLVVDGGCSRMGGGAPAGCEAGGGGGAAGPPSAPRVGSGGGWVAVAVGCGAMSTDGGDGGVVWANACAAPAERRASAASEMKECATMNPFFSEPESEETPASGPRGCASESVSNTIHY